MVQVKRGLEKLYRRVEREVSEEVLEVVWGDMQGCLMQQVAKFNSLIQACYSGESIHLLSQLIIVPPSPQNPVSLWSLMRETLRSTSGALLSRDNQLDSLLLLTQHSSYKSVQSQHLKNMF